MPIFYFPEYSRAILELLNALEATGHAQKINLEIDQRSIVNGFLFGRIIFEDDSELHFREFIDTSLQEPKIGFAYQYQDAYTGCL